MKKLLIVSLVTLILGCLTFSLPALAKPEKVVYEKCFVKEVKSVDVVSVNSLSIGAYEAPPGILNSCISSDIKIAKKELKTKLFAELSISYRLPSRLSKTIRHIHSTPYLLSYKSPDIIFGNRCPVKV